MAGLLNRMGKMCSVFFITVIMFGSISCSKEAEKPIESTDCANLAKGIEVMVGQLSTKKDFTIMCGGSIERCRKFVTLSKKTISLSKKGIEILKGDSNCSEDKGLMDKVPQYEKEIAASEKIVNMFEVLSGMSR